MVDVTLHPSSARDHGFSLIETVIALGLLAVGVLGAAGVFSEGLRMVSSSPGDLVATQKAAEAIESVFSARDSHVLTWAQLRNVKGQTGNDGGIFLDGPQDIRQAGPDGLVNTADDAAQPIESVVYPGPDQLIGTPDDKTVALTSYKREIIIRDVETDLRSIVVTVTFWSGTAQRTFSLTTYISNFS
jgi:prepilin-type N-terminal cleavage/methylation domain-containing protein